MKTLEENIQNILNPSITSTSLLQNYEYSKADVHIMFFECIHKITHRLPYHGSMNGGRVRRIHTLIKENMSQALVSPSSWVRLLAFMISKENDKEWFEKAYRESLHRK